MKKPLRKLSLNRESLRNLSAAPVTGGGTQPSICVGCTTEYTWYCPTASGCSACPICNEP
ncbi:MAG TPA: hypothetical protein VGE98_01095 [Thermoanaerobaculia bacterium]